MLIITTKLCVEEHTAMHDWEASGIQFARHIMTPPLTYPMMLVSSASRMPNGTQGSHTHTPASKVYFYCLAKCSVQVTHIYLFELGGGSCMNLFLSNL
jgi:hypothetical protein